CLFYLLSLHDALPILNPWFLIVLTFVSSYLLVSDMKLFALKFKDWSFKNNAIRYIFIILCVVLLVVLQFAAIPLIILVYIGLSLDRKSTRLNSSHVKI